MIHNLAKGIKCVDSRNPDFFVKPFCGEYVAAIAGQNYRVKSHDF